MACFTFGLGPLQWQKCVCAWAGMGGVSCVSVCVCVFVYSCLGFPGCGRGVKNRRGRCLCVSAGQPQVHVLMTILGEVTCPRADSNCFSLV